MHPGRPVGGHRRRPLLGVLVPRRDRLGGDLFGRPRELAPRRLERRHHRVLAVGAGHCDGLVERGARAPRIAELRERDGTQAPGLDEVVGRADRPDAGLRVLDRVERRVQITPVEQDVCDVRARDGGAAQVVDLVAALGGLAQLRLGVVVAALTVQQRAQRELDEDRRDPVVRVVEDARGLAVRLARAVVGGAPRVDVAEQGPQPPRRAERSRVTAARASLQGSARDPLGCGVVVPPGVHHRDQRLGVQRRRRIAEPIGELGCLGERRDGVVVPSSVVQRVAASDGRAQLEGLTVLDGRRAAVERRGHQHVVRFLRGRERAGALTDAVGYLREADQGVDEQRARPEVPAIVDLFAGGHRRGLTRLERGPVGQGAEGVPGDIEQPRRCGDPVPGRLQVMREEHAEPLRRAGGVLEEPAHRAGVQGAHRLHRQGRSERAGDRAVPEVKRVIGAELAADIARHVAGGDQRVQLAAIDLAVEHRAQQLERGRMTRRRHGLQKLAFGRRQPTDPLQHELVERGRTQRLPRALGLEQPALALADHHPGVRPHVQRVRDVPGHTAGRLVQRVRHLSRPDAPGQASEQRLQVGGGERQQRCVVHPVHGQAQALQAALGLVVAQREDGQLRSVCPAREQVAQQLQGAVSGPLQVIDHKHRRPIGARGVEARDVRVVGGLLRVARHRRQGRLGRARLEDTEQPHQSVTASIARVRRGVGIVPAQQPLDQHARAAQVGEAEPLPQQVEHRQVWAVEPVGAAGGAQHLPPLAASLREEDVEQARLARLGPAADRDHATAATRQHVAGGAPQRRELGRTPDKRQDKLGERGGAGLVAPSVAAPARVVLLQIELAAGLAGGALIEQDLAGLGQGDPCPRALERRAAEERGAPREPRAHGLHVTERDRAAGVGGARHDGPRGWVERRRALLEQLDEQLQRVDGGGDLTAAHAADAEAHQPLVADHGLQLPALALDDAQHVIGEPRARRRGPVARRRAEHGKSGRAAVEAHARVRFEPTADHGLARRQERRAARAAVIALADAAGPTLPAERVRHRGAASAAEAAGPRLVVAAARAARAARGVLTVQPDRHAQRLGKNRHRVLPVVAAPLERAHDLVLHLPRQLGPRGGLADGARSVVEPSPRDVDRGSTTLERHLAREQLIDDDRQRVEVAAAIERLAARLLGRHIGGRTLHEGVALAFAAPAPREAKIDDLGHEPAGGGGAQEDVRGLDVAMDDVVAVGLREGLRDLAGEVHHLLDGERGALAQHHVEQRAAVDQLHRDERRPGELAEVVDGDDVRVDDPRQGAGLGLEAVDVDVVAALGPDELERDEPIEPLVGGPIHVAHGARGDAVLDDVVLGDLGPRAIQVGAVVGARPHHRSFAVLSLSAPSVRAPPPFGKRRPAARSAAPHPGC